MATTTEVEQGRSGRLMANLAWSPEIPTRPLAVDDMPPRLR
jgi:hypothetical protein